MRETKKSRDAKFGKRATRLSVNESDLLDNETVQIATTNQKRLSRCHWEDMLKYSPGQKLAIYFRNDSDLLDAQFASVPNKAKTMQIKNGIGGQLVTISSKQFVVLKATIITAPVHIDCDSGSVSMSQLMTYYDRREGFTIQFDGTDEKLTFSWQEVLDRCEDVYFFGPPANGARRYEKLFYHKTRVSYLQHIFHDLARVNGTCPRILGRARSCSTKKAT